MQHKEMTTGSRNNRHVVPNSSGGWDVKKPDAQRASAHTETNQKAVDQARNIVKNAGGGEVRVHRRDGRIQDSDTILRGNDPFPPRDTKR